MDSQINEERVFYRFEEPETGGPLETIKAPAFDFLSGYGGEVVRETRFWRRQFGDQVTSGQRKFDWVVGVFLPLICFYFDPIVFTKGGILPEFKPFVYVLGPVSIMGMAAWLLWGDRLKWLSGWLAGLFTASSVTSLAVGIALVPISTMCLLVIIGVLGYSPLLASIVYGRNAVRAFRAAKVYFDRRTLVHTAAISGMITITVPYVLSKFI